MYTRECMLLLMNSSQGGNYLFHDIALRVADYTRQHGHAPLNMGVGDVSRPVAPCVAEAMAQAARSMGQAATFRGYPPSFGQPFLRQAVAQYYGTMGVDLDQEDVYISSGAKDDLARWSTLFDRRIPALLVDPTYPAYSAMQQMVGREVVYCKAVAGNNYLPMPDAVPPRQYLIFLCSPSNPTGASYTHSQLTQWVQFALATHSILLFDAAYQRFASPPTSIYHIEGSTACCIEVNSLSKCASFSGLRCGWSVVPASLPDGIAAAWRKMLTTAVNGVSYITQRGAQAALSPEGVTYMDNTIAIYRHAVRFIADTLVSLGIEVVCGPYLWARMPYRASGWQFFEDFLAQDLVVTPGVGFGAAGDAYVRFSVFQLGDDLPLAAERIKSVLQQKI